MNTIKVVERLDNPVLLAPEKGTELFDIMKQELESSAPITVDFDGYKFISSTFFNHSFGQLCLERKLDEASFKVLVTVIGLEEDELDEVVLAIDNAQDRLRLQAEGIDVVDFYKNRLENC